LIVSRCCLINLSIGDDKRQNHFQEMLGFYQTPPKGYNMDHEQLAIQGSKLFQKLYRDTNTVVKSMYESNYSYAEIDYAVMIGMGYLLTSYAKRSKNPLEQCEHLKRIQDHVIKSVFVDDDALLQNK